MVDGKVTIEAFLNAAGAKQPTPGGGSVTALVGALSASMGEMVLNYSIGKKGLESKQDQLGLALLEFKKARQFLLALMVEDQNAYELLSQLQKLPRDSAERKEKYPPALLASIRTPEAMAATAVAILEICQRLTDGVNYYLLSDLAVCADLAMATLRCAIYNVRVNLKELTDKRDRDVAEANVRRLLERGAGLIQYTVPRIWQRFEQGV